MCVHMLSAGNLLGEQVLPRKGRSTEDFLHLTCREERQLSQAVIAINVGGAEAG